MNQIEVFVVDLSAAINESDDVEILDLQVNLESNFLPIGIAHSALAENTNHLSKHLNDSISEDDDSSVEIC